MDTVILKGKQYRNLKEDTIIKKKMIFYDQNNHILLYQWDDEIYVPTVTTQSSDEFITQLHEMTNIVFDPNKIEELIRTINYGFIFETHNNTMRKKYLEYVKEFYTCMIPFDQTFFEMQRHMYQWQASIMSIQEAIDCLMSKRICKENTLCGLQAFQQKVKEKTIC